MLFAVIFLVAAVVSNLVVAQVGPAATFWVALFGIGLNVTSADYVHKSWMGKGLVWKTGCLILSGSVLSWIINRQAKQIAIASSVAFALSSTVDRLVFHPLYRRFVGKDLISINGSNIPSAIVDSLIFPILAFGWPPMWGVIGGQIVAKVMGGFLWSVVIIKMRQWLQEAGLWVK